jgi:2-oxoglutarate ferredoxin oxidoreductase subunit alpha
MGQMMEPVIFPEPIDLKTLPLKPWKLDGADGRPSRIIRSLLLDPAEEEELNWKLVRKYEKITKEIQDADNYMTSDARLVVVAYGTAARIAKGAVDHVREEGLKVGLCRPMTLWPFPKDILKNINKSVKDFLVFEMSTGQMVEDVRLSLEGSGRVHFYGRPGGIISTPQEIASVIREVYSKE